MRARAPRRVLCLMSLLAGGVALARAQSLYILPHAGTPQSQTVGVVYSTDLQAQVVDAVSYGPVPGVTVSFTVHPFSGAGATFLGGGVSAAVVSDSGGLATAPHLTANLMVGPFTVTASALGAEGSAVFNLTNTPAVAPVRLAVTNVNGGSDPIAGSLFPVTVAAVSLDGSLAAVASATGFSLSLKTGTGTLSGNLTGTILAGTAFVAVPGLVYSKAEAGVVVTATRTSGDNLQPGDSPPFTVEPPSGPPAIILATGGTPQSAQLDTPFLQEIQVEVLDAQSKPVPNLTVTFTAPPTGASATFPSGNTAITDASGRAAASIAANSVAGQYTVAANVSPPLPTPAQFALTNTVCSVVKPIASPGAALTGTVGQSFSINFLGTSNGAQTAGPYSFVATGNVPPGLSLSTAGRLSGTPSRAGTYTFTVSASVGGCSGSASFTLRIACPPGSQISFSPSSLPRGAVGVGYAARIDVSGGRAPYRFRYPGGLPPGLSPSESATAVTLTGTPSVPGTFIVTLEAEDDGGCVNAAALSLSVTAVPEPDLQVTIDDGGVAWGDIPADEVGERTITYVVRYRNGGTAAATHVRLRLVPDRATALSFQTGSFSISCDLGLSCSQSLADLPPGASGETRVLASIDESTIEGFTGTDASAIDTYQISLQAQISGLETDANPDDNEDVALTPRCRELLCAAFCPLKYLTGFPCPVIVVTSNSFVAPVGQAGLAYEADFGASGGEAPYTFSARDLPAGLAIDASSGRVFSSTGPSESGEFVATIGARDANGCQGSQTFTLDVCPADGSPLLLPTTLPDFKPSDTIRPMDQPVGEIDWICGTPPFTVSATGLPDGLTADSTSASERSVTIAGAPSTSGTFTLRLVVTDAQGRSGAASYSVRVLGCAEDYTGKHVLPEGQVGNRYIAQPVFSLHGTPPFRYSFAGATSDNPPDDNGGIPGIILGPPRFETEVPPGLSIDAATGQITGVPVKSLFEDYAFDVEVTDADSCTIGHGTYFVTIHDNDSCGSWTVTPSSLPEATLGVPYSVAFALTGGTAPYHFSANSRSDIGLYGLELSPDGILSGIPVRPQNLRGSGPLGAILYLDAYDANDCGVENYYTLIIRPGSTAATSSRTEGAGTPGSGQGLLGWVRGAARAVARAAENLSQVIRDIRLYYEIRDLILGATPGGQRYVQLYYRHASEITQLLMSDPGLRDLGLSAMDAWSPALQALVDGRVVGVTFTGEMAGSMTALLEGLKGQGSAALRQDIEREQGIVNLSSWVGLAIDEALVRFRMSLATSLTLPVAASLHGASASFFHSDVTLTNSSAESAAVTARYRCSTGSCKQSDQTVSLAAGESRVLTDIVATLFQAPETAGAIEFEGPAGVLVESRLYTPSRPAATTGAALAGFPDACAASQAVLTALSHSADATRGFRSNVGVYNPNDVPLMLDFDLRDPQGGPLARFTRPVGPKASVQFRVFDEAGVTRDVADAYCVVRGDGAHRFFAYAAVVDNRTQDSTLVSGRADREASSEPVVLPAATSVHGAGGSFFHSDVRVFNPSTASPVTVVARYRCSSGGCADASRTFTVAPREMKVFDDIVAAFFGAPETSGAIEFTGGVLVESRIYTPARSEPTVGGGLPGLRESEATKRAILTSLSSSPDRTRGFRTNIGLYNPNDQDLTAQISLYDGQGRALGRISLPVPSRQLAQMADAFAAGGAARELEGGYAIVASDAGLPFYAYAAVVDNQSQDPVFIVGRPVR